jgi:hypothetical protein
MQEDKYMLMAEEHNLPGEELADAERPDGPESPFPGKANSRWGQLLDSVELPSRRWLAWAHRAR